VWLSGSAAASVGIPNAENTKHAKLTLAAIRLCKIFCVFAIIAHYMICDNSVDRAGVSPCETSGRLSNELRNAQSFASPAAIPNPPIAGGTE
jgi:hypothetical protein